MGIQADTGTAVAGILLNSALGFTSGDPQSGVAPTQVSDTFLNSVITEVNQIIERVGGGDVAVAFGDSVSDWQQAAKAILYGIAFQRGNSYFINNPAWCRRTFPATGGNVEENWRTWFRNDYKKNVADNTVQAVGHIVVPDNSQFWVEFAVCAVRINSVTIYRNQIVRASCRRNGGAVTVQSVTSVDGNGALIATFDVKAGTLSGEPAAYLEVTLPISVGNFFNISVSATATNVTTGT